LSFFPTRSSTSPLHPLSLHDALPIFRIIETVSNSSLTAFHYEANGVKIDMEREAGAAPAGVSPVAAGNVTAGAAAALPAAGTAADRKSTRLNSSHVSTSSAVSCLKNK